MRNPFTRCIGVFAGVVLSALPLFALATTTATLNLSPASGSYGLGKTFTVNVMVDSSLTFNSANATINFDKELLSVTGVSKTSSAFSLWAVEPSFDNGKGTASFEGGNTTALSGKKTLLAITFKALKEGKATLSFGTASVLAADGKGTDIVGEKNGASFDITAGSADPPPPPPPPPAASSGGPSGGTLPDTPEVASPTHPDETIYSGAPKAKFTWDLPADVTAVRMSLDAKDKTVPTTTYDPAIAEKEFEQLTDGIMYLHIRYKNDAGWGGVAHKKILVDKSPPAKFDLGVNVEGSSTDVTLKFVATDTLSGVDHYEAIVDGGTPIKITLADALSGTYTLLSQSPGDHTLTLKAFDKAGNNMPAEGKFHIVEPPPQKKVDEQVDKPTDWKLIAIIGLIAFIAFLIGYSWYERGAFRHEKYLIKREADELRDKMGNIFAALREEVGEQVGRLYSQPIPSALDREVSESINGAVDLSEELLSKEVEDVRKLLI